MRNQILGILCLSILSLPSAYAARVILQKTTSPGFVMPAYAISKTCKIHDNGQITQHYQVASAASLKTGKLKLRPTTGGLIDEAALGKITETITAVDIPSVSYVAFQKTNKKVILRDINGGTGVEKTNESEAATILRNFIDLNCGDPIE